MQLGYSWTLCSGWIFCVFMASSLRAKEVVKFAIITPSDGQRLFSTHRVAPVIRYSISRIKELDLLPDVRFLVSYGDSKCNSKDAPIKAFDFYKSGYVSVFLGPVCDYSLAPVARYAPYWNKPVISPGGFAHDFGRGKHSEDAEYRTLTRVGATFNSLAKTVIGLVQHYEWHRIKVIYDGEGHSDIAPRFCFLAASAFVSYSKKKRLDYDFHMFIPKVHKVEDMLREEVGNQYNSKLTSFITAKH
ncbi:hypothetical protein SNE40_007306 [Patella caerulea]|uniref:Receptor ligand binding region domain-containing protein n=1 Tax=Patella caerulea TaxID=87958 RepID=A0AAN8K5P6_PATCE